MARQSTILAIILAVALPLAPVGLRKQVTPEDLLADEDDDHESPEALKTPLALLEVQDRPPLNVENTEGVTRMSFRLPAHPPDASALSELASDEEEDETVPEELKPLLWSKEKSLFNEQEGVKDYWHHTATYNDYSKSDIKKVAVKRIKNMLVPGLGGVKFGKVFRTIAKNGCPIWMMGGTVRDLMAGKTPNDVDCAVLCHSDKVREIAVAEGWQNDGGDGKYWSIGETHGDNPNYLEGFSMDLVFRHPMTVEWTVNMLMWSLTYDKVIDPSGQGIADAANTKLRIGAPAPIYMKEEGEEAPTQWAVWREWLMSGFAGAKMQRHIRYLKMRGRGWQPASRCMVFFMADQYIVAAAIENLMNADVGLEADDLKNRPSLIRTDSGSYSVSDAATLLHISEKVLAKTATQKESETHRILDVMKEDLDVYFAMNAKSEGCLANGERTGKELFEDFLKSNGVEPFTSAKDVITGGLHKQCENPSEMTAAYKAHEAQMEADIINTCRYIKSYVEALA